MGRHRNTRRHDEIREWLHVGLLSTLALSVAMVVVALSYRSQNVKLKINTPDQTYVRPSEPPRPVDGTFTAGRDLKPGEWASEGGGHCSWEIREGRNVLATGGKTAVTVELRDGQSLVTKGCGKWKSSTK